MQSRSSSQTLNLGLAGASPATDAILFNQVFKLMNNAQRIIAALLEEEPYDIDDPLEKPEYPAGFIAHKGAEKVEWQHHEKPNHQTGVPGHGYYFSKHWPDSYTGRPRVLKDFAWKQTPTAEKAQSWLHLEAAKWQEAGWQIEWL